jgi:hypothetical protein
MCMSVFADGSHYTAAWWVKDFFAIPLFLPLRKPVNFLSAGVFTVSTFKAYHSHCNYWPNLFFVIVIEQ